MPPKKKSNPFTGYVSLIGGLIPIIGVLLGLVIYIVNLNQTINDNAVSLEAITEQLNNPAVKEFLEPDQWGETPMSSRLNGFEFALWEELLPQIEAAHEQLLLIEITLKDLSDSYDGTLYYLYTQDSQSGGVQQSLQSVKTHLSVIEKEIENIMADHAWYADYISKLDEQLLEILGIRIQVPQDTGYGGGYGNYR